ncbi:S8 family serine peptidase [Gottfriedia sp. NPDC056225]|uniref:S8 family serine peptidase n=1 Tax=Gottfriedia sp. NPDC056225 TaxID=3345751 RepID=UPI0035D78C4C
MSNSKKIPFRVITATTLAAMFLTTPGYAQITKENQSTSFNVDEKAQGGLKDYLDNLNKEAAKDSANSVYKNMNEENSKGFSPNEKVRVIVEVQEPEQATQITQTKSKVSKKVLMKQKQDDVVSKMSKQKLSPKIRHRFYEGFNGFSLDTEYKNIKELQATPGVTNVHIARTYEQTMKTSKELVQAQSVWEKYGYEGEGLVVGVVDSGIDYTHKDMTLTEKGKQKEKLTESNIQSKFTETSVNEKWYSDKVPTGYDWADNDTDVIPRGQYANPHGTHVSGTIGANGNEENDGVLGIAPGVQLLAEKVFSDNGSVGAYEDDIIAGINHAVEMGADVINMSLGTDSGFVGEDKDPIQKAIREATEHGTLVVVAGGNAAYSTKNSIMTASAQPYAENPDIGTVGEPGVSPFALSVASYENTNYELSTLGEENGLQLPYQDQTQYDFKLSRVLSPNESYELVYVGEGFKDEHYAGKDVNGKIVVFRPNTSYSTYASMQSQAKKRGAKAVILVPATNMSDYPYVNFGSNLTPAATTSKSAGNALIDKLNSGQVVKMKVTKGTWIDNPERDTMSYFSSYGAPTTLDFKPEISAPGGKIYSTTPGNEYEVMSGTSMATPHVAGGAALIMQSLYEKGLTHSEDTALKAKIALMNTAKMVMDPKTNNKVPYSPRIQGSGLMQIQNAIKTPVIVTRKNTPLEQAGAVALKEIKNDRAIFNLNVESLETKGTKKDYEYTVNVDLLTDGIDTKQFDFDGDGTLESKDYLSLKSTRVEGASIYVNGEKLTGSEGATLKIKGGQTKNLNVEIRLPRTLKKNEFVEGFVRLVPTGTNSDTAVPLTVPYMGFNGDWTELNNIDPAAWDRKDAFLGYTALWNDEGASVPMGYDNKTGKFNMNAIATSPNSILKGVFPTFTAFRNLAKAEMYIEDKKGKMIKYLGDFSEYNGGKSYPLRKNILSASRMYMGYNWDSKDQNGNTVSDDTYNFVIKTTFDYPGAKPQKVKLPVKVDSVGPKVSNVQVTPKDGQYEISFDAVDSSSGYLGAILWYNGIQKSVSPGETSVLVSEEPKSVVVMGIDNAMNISYKVWGDPSYIKYSMLVPTFSISPSTNINASKPASIYGFAQTRVNWTIYVKDTSGKIVDSMQVNNEHQINTKWTPDANLASGTYTISADAVDKEGFKVTTKTVTVTVVK